MLHTEAQAGTIPMESARDGGVVLTHTNQTRLTVIGPASGKTYIFEGRGSRAMVDGRDSVAMAGMRGLLRVS